MHSVTGMEQAGYQDGARIRKLRKRQLYGLEEFADVIGITRQHLSNIENNRRPISMTIAVQIAAELHVSVSDLLNKRLMPTASRAPVSDFDDEPEQVAA